MKIPLINWLLLGSTIIMGIGVVLGVMFYSTIQRQLEEASWVKQKYATVNQVATIQKLLVDMETGQRAFRHTAEQRFLLPYTLAQAKIEPALDRLGELMTYDSVQTYRFTQLKTNAELLLKLWSSSNNPTTQSNRLADVQFTDQESNRMYPIRQLLDVMQQTEERQLVIREKLINDQVNRVTYQTVLGTSLLFLVAAILTYFYFLEFKGHRKIESQLNQTVKELEQLNLTSNERNWFLLGLSAVNDSLHNVHELESVTQEVLKALTRYLDVPAAGFYCYSEQEQHLELNASVAFPASAPRLFALGEGLVGQAANEHEPLITRSIPATYWAIQSGSGLAIPGEVICVPLWYGNELKGVIELATFQPITERHQHLLKTVASDIATAINSVQSHAQIVELLGQVQEQKNILENQQEELHQTNEELTRQTESLQASEEELRVQEEELRQINTELEEKNEAIEVARQALVNKAHELEVTSKYKSEFLANMSHELRTPLNSVLILANLLAENKYKNLTEKQIEYATVIHKSGADLLKLINDILDLSKIEAGKIDFQIENVPTNSIIRDMNQLFSVVAEEKGVRMLTNLAESVPASFFTDKQRLEQIIQNLLSNAFKFTPRGGSVTLTFNTARQAGGFNNELLIKAEQILLVSVSDTGIGISPDKQQVIFEAFQQADGSTSRKYGGTGLGLSIIKELAKRLGGEVRLQSEVGQGSTFTVYLPLTTTVPTPKTQETKNVSEPQPLPSLPVSWQPAADGPTQLDDDRNNLEKGDRVMLIIEDDPVFAGIVRDFARSKHYKTIVALQGDEGMKYAQQYKPSAIILDMQLPVVDGWGILNWLKSQEDLKHIPVHVISGTDESRVSLGGALAYIQKPVGMQDLERTFTLIGTQLNVQVKKVLIWSETYLNNKAIDQVIEQRYTDLKCDFVATKEEALSTIRNQSFDCLIVDLRKELKKGIENLKQLRDLLADDTLPIIVFIDEDLNPADERQLKKLASVVIRESSQSTERLMDELELFLYKVHEGETKKLPKPIAGAGNQSLQGKKVLLVDDDMRNVFALSTLLDEQQMQVVTADNGREALDMLQQHTDTDIVLMDIMMPEMDGYEATRRIRDDLRMRHLPIIALTAKAMPGDREKAIEAGASDYISKPVDSGQLFSLMRVWLSK